MGSLFLGASLILKTTTGCKSIICESYENVDRAIGELHIIREALLWVHQNEHENVLI